MYYFSFFWNSPCDPAHFCEMIPSYKDPVVQKYSLVPEHSQLGMIKGKIIIKFHATLFLPYTHEQIHTKFLTSE